MTGGATYRHANGIWAGTVMEYGSGTPMGHGRAAHDHEAGEVDHEHALSAGRALRVPRHFTANFSVGADLLRFSSRRGRLLLQVAVENVTNRVYLIAQDGEFSPAQYSPPRLVAATVRLRF